MHEPAGFAHAHVGAAQRQHHASGIGHDGLRQCLARKRRRRRRGPGGAGGGRTRRAGGRLDGGGRQDIGRQAPVAQAHRRGVGAVAANEGRVLGRGHRDRGVLDDELVHALVDAGEADEVIADGHETRQLLGHELHVVEALLRHRRVAVAPDVAGQRPAGDARHGQVAVGQRQGQRPHGAHHRVGHQALDDGGRQYVGDQHRAAGRRDRGEGCGHLHTDAVAAHGALGELGTGSEVPRGVLERTDDPGEHAHVAPRALGGVAGPGVDDRLAGLADSSVLALHVGRQTIDGHGVELALLEHIDGRGGGHGEGARHRLRALEHGQAPTQRLESRRDGVELYLLGFDERCGLRLVGQFLRALTQSGAFAFQGLDGIHGNFL